MRAELRPSLRTVSLLALTVLAPFAGAARGQSPNSILPGPKPADVPSAWKPWIGEYGSQAEALFVFERDGKLWISGKDFGEREFKPWSSGILTATVRLEYVFALSVADGQLDEIHVTTKNKVPKVDHTFRLQQDSHLAQSQTVEELRKLALAAEPPHEGGSFRKPELVEIGPLDPSIRLDIRYATANDFLGTPVYSQARAFLQRPAAAALLRVQQKLKPLGYGLLIHDAYRPWYVTKIFWDATPPEGKIFVADPAQGSRHNRGCAVDLTLYDLASGKPIEMPGTYDEMSPRSFPDYPGGTSLQRWHRDLLRRAMESEGFTVYEAEWWHFDYKDWKEYAILNVPFEKLGLDPVATQVH